MGGEYYSTTVYGFVIDDEYVRLRGGGSDVYIGATGRPGRPIYFCLDIKSTELEKINEEIANLTEEQLKRIASFDEFAKKYGYKACWQVACVGDIEVNVRYDTNDEVLNRLNELECDALESEIKVYDEDGEYSMDMKDSIEIILLEEGMGFMVKDAFKTKKLTDVYAMVEEFYSME